MKKLPRDLSTFETLITQDYVYVDKTEQIYHLYATGDRYHFFSRPRRFGKSLLISTLKELFLGNKHLFKDLWIDSSNYQWQKYPIVHIDFAAITDRTSHDLQTGLNQHLDDIAHSYGFSLESKTLPEEKLALLITELSHFNKVVLLVDEYNYPLLGHLGAMKLAEEQEKILTNFYGILKGLDAYLHVIFITGVSKFSKSTIFSGINNLIDIGMSSLGTSLVGFTSQEIEKYFHEHINAFSQAKNKTATEIIHEMKTMYNGYRFNQEKISLHNPFAVLYYLKEQEVRNYWYESGVPLLLVNLLFKQLESLDTIGIVEFDAETIDVFDINNIPLITLLFQTGYLTIKNYNKDTNKFTLNYPNPYIAEAFKKNVIEALAHTNAIIIEQSLVSIKKALLENDLDKLCSTLQMLFAYIPQHLPIEPVHYFYVIFKVLLSLLATKIESKISKEKDALSLTMITYTHLYKGKVYFNVTAQELEQISKMDRAPEEIDKNHPRKLINFILICMQTAEGVKVTYQIIE